MLDDSFVSKCGFLFSQGGTPTLGTGPANAYSGDQYAYIEVTKKRKNKVAILSTLNKVLDGM